MTAYLSDIWRLRYFWLALVRADLQKRYRRSVLGIGWSLLHPIAMTIVLCIVFTQLFGQSVRVYAPLLLSGLTYWGFMTSVVMQGCHSLYQNESYIRQHPAPLAIYPLRITLSAGFHFLLGIGIAIVFVWCVKGFGNLPALLSLLPTFALLFVVGWSLAICMSVVNVMFHDLQHLVEIFMQIMFYVTPIMYPPKVLLTRLEKLNLEWLINLNPFAVFLQLIREPLLEDRFPSWGTIGVGTVFGFLAVATATTVLKRFEKHMIFYL